MVANRTQGFCLAPQLAAGGIDRIAASSQGAAFRLITRGLRAEPRCAHLRQYRNRMLCSTFDPIFRGIIEAGPETDLCLQTQQATARRKTGPR